MVERNIILGMQDEKGIALSTEGVGHRTQETVSTFKYRVKLWIIIRNYELMYCVYTYTSFILNIQL